MFGLFERKYDYYEWDNLVAVSKSKKKLIEKYKSIETDYELIRNTQYQSFSDSEKSHYAIVKVEFL